MSNLLALPEPMWPASGRQRCYEDSFSARQMRELAAKVLAEQAAEIEALRADAERWRTLLEKTRGPVPMVRVLVMKRGQYTALVGGELDAALASGKAVTS